MKFLMFFFLFAVLNRAFSAPIDAEVISDSTTYAEEKKAETIASEGLTEKEATFTENKLTEEAPAAFIKGEEVQTFDAPAAVESEQTFTQNWQEPAAVKTEETLVQTLDTPAAVESEQTFTQNWQESTAVKTEETLVQTLDAPAAIESEQTFTQNWQEPVSVQTEEALVQTLDAPAAVESEQTFTQNWQEPTAVQGEQIEAENLEAPKVEAELKIESGEISTSEETKVPLDLVDLSKDSEVIEVVEEAPRAADAFGSAESTEKTEIEVAQAEEVPAFGLKTHLDEEKTRDFYLADATEASNVDTQIKQESTEEAVDVITAANAVSSEEASETKTDGFETLLSAKGTTATEDVVAPTKVAEAQIEFATVHVKTDLSDKTRAQEICRATCQKAGLELQSNSHYLSISEAKGICYCQPAVQIAGKTSPAVEVKATQPEKTF